MSKIEAIEEIIRNAMQKELVEPRDLVVAFHNICAHGELFEDWGWNVTDANLEALFYGLDGAINALETMEKGE